MHNSLILVNRTLPAEHFYSANNKAAKAILPLAAEASEEADLSSTRANDIAVDEPSAINFPADYKVLRTLAAQYALADFELLWETGIDAATRLFTVCRGTGDQLDSIDAARARLEQIGGPS